MSNSDNKKGGSVADTEKKIVPFVETLAAHKKGETDSELTYELRTLIEAGNVTIPDSILLRMAPFDGADAVEMGARIRYRIDAGALRIGYVLDRPDLVLRTAFAAVIAGVEDQTGITALWGTPRS